MCIVDGVLIVWYLCSVPNLVQIYVIVTEIDALMFLTFGDVTRINFRFRSRPVRRNVHVILHQAAKFRPN